MADNEVYFIFISGVCELGSRTNYKLCIYCDLPLRQIWLRGDAAEPQGFAVTSMIHADET
jgi:hypothetical protein